jgi:hypothetical protein
VSGPETLSLMRKASCAYAQRYHSRAVDQLY